MDINDLLNNPSNKKIHFIGIGGSSMSGLAQMLNNIGCIISGSDINDNKHTALLREKGFLVNIGHSASYIVNPDAVIYTAAINADNPELLESLRKNILTIDRATLLGAIMKKFSFSIAISGTHGKSTTTSMISSIMLSAEKDPTIHIGSDFPLIGGNIRIGNSEIFISEACEYKDSFLKFLPYIVIILNIELDHVDYFKDIEQYICSFRNFAMKVPKDGFVIGCIDDKNIRDLLPQLDCNIATYGITSEDADYRATDITFDEAGLPTYTLLINQKEATTITLNVPGLHNILNSLASIATAFAGGCSIESIKHGLLNFTGASKRYDIKGVRNGIKVIDDYAHHPTEIRATLAAIRNSKHNKIWCVFQPHTYTRLKKFESDFMEALKYADGIIITSVYAARETADERVNPARLSASLNECGKEAYFIKDFQDISDFLREHTVFGDIIVTLGAGDICKVGEMFLVE